MKQFAKTLGVTCVAALALAAMTAVGASAATFTASATGSLTGTQTNHHVFTPGGGGSVTCKKGHLTATIVGTQVASQHVTVTHSECTAFGFLNATVSDATYEVYANGTLDVENTITISVSGCTTTIKPQSGLKSISFTNSGPKLITHFNISGIVSTASGFPCTGGTNGTTTGSFIIERVGGGSASWDG